MSGFKRLAVLCLIASGLVGCDKGGDSRRPHRRRPTARKLDIAVIPKGTTHSFWKSVQAGAQKASDELGVNMIWKGPLKEDDRAEQIKVVDTLASQGVSGMVLAPLDDTALLRPVQSAVDKKIPVVIFDSALKGEVGKDFISFVATDNRKGGELAGEEMARILDGKGKVVLMRYQEGSASTDERESGFLAAIGKHPGIEITMKDRYAGAGVSEAKDSAMRLVERLREADGIFCPNESSTQGMLMALRQIGIAGKVKFVGFDASGPLVEALKAGEIQALVSQNPVKMGYEGVKAVVTQIRGTGAVPPRIDTGVQLITKSNLEDPLVKQLIGEQ